MAIGSDGVAIAVKIPGPESVEGGCVDSLTAWLVAEDGHRIVATPSPGVRCMAIAIDNIPAGQSRDYKVTLPRPSPGTYAVHGLVRIHLPIGASTRAAENIAVVTFQV